VKSDVIAQPAVVGARPRDATPLSRRLRVLMIVESSAGGTGRHVLDLCDGLIAAGCDVHLVHSCRRIDQMFIDRLAAVDGLRCLSLPIRTSPHPADIGVLRAIRRYARQHGPFDIVHGHSSKGGALARLAALGTPAAAFYTLHGLIMMDDGLSRVKRAFYLAIELGLSLRTKRIIAVSPEEARAAVRMGLGRSRVMTIPNGIDELELTPRGIARRMMRVDDGDVVIGFVGRLVEQKSPHVLIEAFARAAGRSRRHCASWRSTWAWSTGSVGWVKLMPAVCSRGSTSSPSAAERRGCRMSCWRRCRQGWRWWRRSHQGWRFSSSRM
jgi:glycosyltransferase involved in cell wall biosynthesis